MLVQCHDVYLSFPDKRVLDGVSLSVHHGERIALVGENGAGKTCLFRILLGRLTPDAGKVSIATGVRIGYLDQTLIDVGGEAEARACLDVALEPFMELQALERGIEQIHARLATCGQDEMAPLMNALGEAQRQFESGGGYDYRSRAEATLSGLGLPAEVWRRPVGTLSAGQKVRLALVRLLLGEHDLLLLDEPTNHLDLPAREWLEERLAKMAVAYVVASHDRRFLDGVASKVAHLDGGNLRVYTGNYSAFRAQIAHDLDTAWRLYDKRQRLVRKLQEQARTYRTWGLAKEREKRGRVDKGYIGHKAAKLMKKSLIARRRLEATIEKMQTEKPRGRDPVAIAFHGTAVHRLLSVRDLSVGYDAPLARGITVTLAGDERLAVLGGNGCGKTTLLRTLLGELPPLAGEVRLTPSARIGYFDQEIRQIPDDQTALEAVMATGRDETLVRTVMGRMRIRRETVHKAVGLLSAGERAKVLLVRLILGEHNLLVLDEPTNFLDIDTQDALLEALADFPGGIIFTSHDRHFIETLATGALELG